MSAALLLSMSACGRIAFDEGADAMNAIIPSCVDQPTCGPDSDSCCANAEVPGGTVFRSYDVGDDMLFADMSAPASISAFRLDRYEVTVGRFKAYLADGAATQQRVPVAGSGAHARIADSGWDPAWNAELAPDVAALTAALSCDDASTWTKGNDALPMGCVTWFDAMAFCVWDGGYLPTEAEWNYAAAGGNEQRAYPWSTATSTAIDCTHSRYAPCGSTIIDPVGTYSPTGDARWGHSDLAGGLWEWVLDRWPAPYTVPCVDCTDLSQPVSIRTNRGGCYGCPADRLRTAWRGQEDPTVRRPDIGWRCARPL